MALMNSNAMINLNRMTFLMSISEITPQLFISGQMAATVEQIQKLGITYILNVAIESTPIVYPKPIKLEKFDIIDFPTAPISNYFNILTDKMHTHITTNKQNKVLVHCMAGISRSVTIVCAYLVRYMNMTLRDAYLLCKRHRPICFPNLGFWNQLISYEYQIRKENSVKMIPTQFGHVPDVAFEEIKQMRNQQQQQQQPASLPFFAPTFASTLNNPSINSSTTNDTLFLSSSQSRPTARDITITNSTGTTRSRSLASNAVNRPTIMANSTNVNNSIYQTPLVTTNKQLFSTPTRYGISRLNPSMTTINSSLPLGPTSSQNSYASTRTLPITTSPNIKQRNNHYHQPATVTATLSNTSTNNEQQRSHYETTYRSSFIKPLVP
ncbi:unnamed protein product [Rotaria sp. Silwood2]|nr:unnamed protein product [Rotaria sp. Silwood2]CAF2482777.1 unnamed protein product [Rotaria sp. Silwood2]CAF2866938.1 unnamed protein product [Rotaria sp. Silwood2]CAF4310301.1 unnamed protein product [Rotaria sp. Silwood2]CAF4398994.1 unnamed protein product [Rotaria sp. Silwood2]